MLNPEFTPRRCSLILAAVSWLALSACDNRGIQAEGVTARDSAGVRILDVNPASWPPDEAWRIDVDPSVDIGVMGGDADYELFDVRGVVRLPDGRFTVAEGNVTLRYYDSVGTHLVTSVLKGPGPGEAQAFLDLVSYRADSLLFITERMRSDPSRDRLLILDQNGAYGRDVIAWYRSGRVSTDTSVSVNQAGQGIQAALSDGTFIVVGRGIIGPGTREDPRVPANAALMRLSPEGESLDTIATVRVGQYEARPHDQRKWELMLSDAVAPPPRTHRDLVYWTPGDRYVVDVFSVGTKDDRRAESPGSARLTKSYRIHAPLSPVTDAYRERYIDTIVQLAGGNGNQPTPPGYRERLNSLLSPDSVPAVQDLRVDSEGFIWLEPHQILGREGRRRFRRQGALVETDSSPWIVLDPQGELIGLVEMPPGLEVAEIGKDWVLGLWADGFGIQHVRLHQLTRGSR